MNKSETEEYEELCDPFNHTNKCTYRLRAFAWSVILATYSEQFVAKAGPERVKTWVDSVCRYNTEEVRRSCLVLLFDNEKQTVSKRVCKKKMLIHFATKTNFI